MFISGHLNAIFSEVCSKIKDLVGDQLSVVESKEGKQAAVSNQAPRSSRLTTHFARQFCLWADLVKTSTLSRNLTGVSVMLKFNNQPKR
jgi:hypothetical protein